MAAAPTVVILAAGEGTRMRSGNPKALHELAGRPLFLWPVAAAQHAGAESIVVVDGPQRALETALPDGIRLAVQAEPRGTGDAVKAAAAHFGDGPVVVLFGDVPLVTAEFIAELTDAHERSGAQATMVTMVLDDPGAYGRVVRDASGDVERVVEAKAAGDATAEQLALKEVNTGIFCFDPGPLAAALEEIRPDNAQGEYYLPDVLPALRARGGRTTAHVTADSTLTLGVNDRADLAALEQLAQRRIQTAHMRAGVTILQPASTHIDVDVTIGRDTVIWPGTTLRGATTIGESVTLGPHTTAIDSTIDDAASVVHSYLMGAHVGESASVGPFAYLRPGADLRERAKAGTFVEVKNSVVGRGSKVPHLSYVGDATIGEDSNLGAATITANYDGHTKHRTTIGDRVRTSVDTTLVAPVSIGDDAYTGAGSVITEDVPAGALGIARERQTNVEGYATRKAPKER
jgi:bifunctional UDP-N-acetylglucosamine pyrophosphorylase / glucosamine-1-phosphate N-acetyltransferase